MASDNGRSATAAAKAPRQQAAASRPRLQLVRNVTKLRPGLIGTVVISLVFSTLFVLAVLQAVLVQGQLHLDQLDQQIKDRTAEKARREVEVATAESPDRIQEAAAANGLVAPPDVVFLERASVQALEGPGGSVSLELDPADAPAAPVTSIPVAAVTPLPAPVSDQPVAIDPPASTDPVGVPSVGQPNAGQPNAGATNASAAAAADPNEAGR